MTSNLPLDSASHSLAASNIIYVVGAVLTLASAAMVLYEKNSKNRGIELRWGLTTEIVVVIAAFISLAGTFGAIGFGNTVGKIKDANLATYQKVADMQIAQANKDSKKAIADAATANQKAQEAKDHAEILEMENIKLGGQVGKDAATARAAEAALDAKNKENSDFAHSLDQQQATMKQQAKVSPVLTDFQITQLTNALALYRGQDVIFHSTADTTVLRLKQTIAVALMNAGITFKNNSMDIGMLYQGVSVAVHDPQNVPPLANALVAGLRQAGIDVHPVAAPEQVPAGQVALYLGPN